MQEGKDDFLGFSLLAENRAPIIFKMAMGRREHVEYYECSSRDSIVEGFVLAASVSDHCCDGTCTT